VADSRHFIVAYFYRCVLKKFSGNNIWTDLLPYADHAAWRPYVRFCLNKIPPIWTFFPSQQDAIERGLLTFARAFSLQTPTSSGKTSITELVIYHEIRRNPAMKILYLAPFRALASELRINLGRNLNAKLGIRIKTIYGGSVVTEWDRISIQEATVLISTPEKFMAVETNEPGILADYDLVICDEGHLIDSSSRGISYELLLSRLKRNEVRPKRFLFLSAIIPNIGAINAWLGGERDGVAISNYRPTEIQLAFLDRKAPRRYDLEINPHDQLPKKYIVESFLSEADFQGQGVRFTPTSNKAKVAAAALRSLNSGAVAIFAPTKDDRKGVAATALEIINLLDFGLPKPADFADPVAIADLAAYFELVFGHDFLLCNCVRNGFLFHHGDLPQFVRELIEAYTRHEKIKLLICTNTLSEGVNLPIKTLVIQGTKRYNGSGSVPIEHRDLKNLIGRAGRAGKEIKGTIILINPDDLDTFGEVIANEGLEPVDGFLAYVLKVIDDYIIRNGAALTNELLDELRQSDIIDDAIIHLLAEDIDIDQLENDIKELTRNTFTYFQSNPDRQARLEEIFDLRTDRIRQAVQDNKIQRIRTTGIPLRLYDQYIANITFDAPILATLDDPGDSIWLEFLFDNMDHVQRIQAFMPAEYNRAQLIRFITRWFDGAWYDELGQVVGQDVNEALELMKFFEYEFQNVANRIIRYVTERRTEAGLDTSAVVTEWTNYLSYGVRTRLQLLLIELGLTERIVLHPLSNWLTERELIANDREALKDIIAQQAEAIRMSFQNSFPLIAWQHLESFIVRQRLN
jgi:superfamily II DNA/RNA helicase